ncbi:PKD domain-containing protein [Catalinimonas alkaloidigena]|uniref:PKD domain-containing protein n=1 Tax=Catalinimonas alkaloidigena TaxID=1075417 RepID=A0A1G9J0Y8_9BACT|nr:PKD domain-containing protein [Catalinimonas alkaloidigena]SDL30784.1 PKD domain-containing protein [Catalinimonas alkaloidigena]
MKRILPYILLLVPAAVLVQGCSQDEAAPDPDIFYQVATNGMEVTFTNETTGATAYEWDFGDGETSTEASPTHTYPGKGKYVVTLYATASDGHRVEGSTILRLSKNSPVKLTDNSLDDWNDVATVTLEGSAETGVFKRAKVDYDSEKIYFYLEMTSKAENGDIFDFYLDTDNNASTGLLTWYFPEGAYDVLLEGAVLGGWFDMFYHVGEQTAFSFEAQSVPDFYQLGTVQQEGNLLRMEMALVRSKIKGLAGNALRFGIVATSNDWSTELGVLPTKATNAVMLDMSE